MHIFWVVADAAELEKRKAARGAARDQHQLLAHSVEARPVPKVPYRKVDTSRVAIGHMNTLAAALAAAATEDDRTKRAWALSFWVIAAAGTAQPKGEKKSPKGWAAEFSVSD